MVSHRGLPTGLLQRAREARRGPGLDLDPFEFLALRASSEAVFQGESENMRIGPLVDTESKLAGLRSGLIAQIDARGRDAGRQSNK